MDLVHPDYPEFQVCLRLQQVQANHYFLAYLQLLTVLEHLLVLMVLVVRLIQVFLRVQVDLLLH
jgi:hypothetical protein